MGEILQAVGWAWVIVAGLYALVAVLILLSNRIRRRGAETGHETGHETGLDVEAKDAADKAERQRRVRMIPAKRAAMAKGRDRK